MENNRRFAYSGSERVRFSDLVRLSVEYYAESGIIKVGNLVLMFSLFAGIAFLLLISANDVIRALAALTLMIAFAFAGIYLLRFFVWGFYVMRGFWSRYRPPFSDEDFVFELPISGYTYYHNPNHSALRFFITFLCSALIIWTGAHFVLRPAVAPFVGFLYWIGGLFPESAISLAFDVVSVFLGLPGPEEIGGRSRIIEILRFLLWFPSYFITGLFLWEMTYYFDRVFTTEHSTVHPNIEGDLYPNARGFIAGIRVAHRSARDGLLDAAEGKGVFAFKSITIPVAFFTGCLILLGIFQGTL